jgi:hypothetical protein
MKKIYGGGFGVDILSDFRLFHERFAKNGKKAEAIT